MQVSHGLGHIGMDRRRIQDAIRPGTVLPCPGLWPAIAWRHQAEIEEAAIAHGSRAGANVIGELRPDQNDNGRIADRMEIRPSLAPGHREPRGPGVWEPRRPATLYAPVRRVASNPGGRKDRGLWFMSRSHDHHGRLWLSQVHP